MKSGGQRRRLVIAIGTLLLTLSGSAGCRSFLNLLGEPDRLRTALVTESTVDVINPFTAFDPLLRAMSAEMGREVQIEPVFAFQAAPQLASGWFELAVATPAQLAVMQDDVSLRVIAAPGATRESVARPALLIVAADSEIEQASEVSGRRVVFGPRGDARTHYAAATLLREAGVDVASLPGPTRVTALLGPHEGNARQRMLMLLEGAADATFVDEAVWSELPQVDERSNEPARRKFRAIGRTASLPDWLFLASATLDDETVGEIRDFLLRARFDHADAVAALGYNGFFEIDQDTIARCFTLAPVAEEMMEFDEPPADPEGESESSVRDAE